MENPASTWKATPLELAVPVLFSISTPLCDWRTEWKCETYTCMQKKGLCRLCLDLAAV
jgi:hypothetical protein